jgi:endonuclease-3 related protein
MPTLRESFPRLVSALVQHFGRPRRLVDSRSWFERLIVCIWERVISAKQTNMVLEIFEKAGLSNSQALAELDPAALQDLLRQEGLSVSAKAVSPLLRAIRRLASYPELAGDPFDGADRIATSLLREELVAIPGIGPATADDILLKVFERPRYPLDRATYRILLRHGWIDSTANYEETGDLLIRNSDEDPNLLADLSLWFEELGRSHCRSSGPKCERCPLQDLLPAEGPLEGES